MAIGEFITTQIHWRGISGDRYSSGVGDYSVPDKNGLIDVFGS